MSRKMIFLPLAILAALALFCVGELSVSLAQQPDPKPQGRPRRVGSDAPKPADKAAPPASGQVQEVDSDDVVRVETQLVSVPAVVSDTNGRPLANLRAENFILYEDNKPQQISNFTTTEAPFEVALLLDTSGSTREDVALIKGAAKAFISALRPGDRVALAAYNTKRDEQSTLATVEVLARLTTDRAVLERAVERIGASNGTPFYDSLVQIADEVFKDPPTQQFKGRRALVALTDGVDSTSLSEFADAKDKLQCAGVASYFIQVNTEEFVEDRLLNDCRGDGTLRLSRTQLQRYRHIYAPRSDAEDYADFCKLGQFERMSISRSLYKLARREMAELASNSGGKTFDAADLRDARAAFAQVAREIGTQYSLGYYPTNKARDGQYRQIRVTLKGVAGQAQVRAREGYYAPRA
jgi:VWFA-related protein